jgi:tetratricopeptide (TPR) repeat protein
LVPDYVEARNNLAAAYASLGDLPAAVEEWQKTLEIDAGHISARQNLEQALRQLGQPAAKPREPSRSGPENHGTTPGERPEERNR